MQDERRMNLCRESSLLKGLAAGVVAGLVASWTMNQLQALCSKLMDDEERPHGAQSLQQGSSEHGVGQELKDRGSDDADDNAAVTTAKAVSELAFDHKMRKSDEELG